MSQSAPSVPVIVPLCDAEMESLRLVGGKAAQLGVMMRAGLPVPDGFCITTAAYGAMDSDLEGQIRAAYRMLGGGAVAVRSSATVEDLPAASFAGQQDTFLNLRGIEPIVEAVVDCWKSLHSERAVAYRRERGIPESGISMAVVVQRMVRPDAAGVLFTLDPVTGAMDEIVVEAARGLGDAVVAARVTPDRYRLSRRAPHEVLGREGAGETTGLLTPQRLAELARMALQAERLLGRAADVEWALGDGQFHLLQARAVTAAGPRLPDVRFGSRWNVEHCRGLLLYWSNFNVRETMPYPHTPFSRSFWNYLALPHAGVAVGLLEPEDLQDVSEAPNLLDQVDGRFYCNLNIAAGMMPRWLLAGITRALDTEAGEVVAELYRSGQLERVRRRRSLRQRLRAARRTAARIARLPRDLDPERAWRKLRMCRDEVEAFSRIDTRILSEEQILALARYYPSQNVPRVFETFAAAAPALGAMTALRWALPRWGFADALPRLLSGIPGNPTLETALALWDVAASAPAEVRAVFEREPITRVRQVLAESDAGRAFLERFSRFLEIHGHRAVREFDFSCPRWREEPTFLLETMRNYLAHPPGEPTPPEHYRKQVAERDAAKQRLDRALRLRPLRRALFRWANRCLERRLALREAPKFYSLIGMAHVRDLYLEVGRRMVARGVLDREDDFFFLSIPEIERLATEEGGMAWIRQQIPLRRREFAAHMRLNPPLVIRSDGRPVGATTRAGSLLRGTPVSWGSARGPARILLDPGDGARLEKGDILVAPFTDPGWTPLFLTAGALVMEIGGIISHGAVVAREYGIPAIVGVKDATRVLRDGELLEVDGSTGEVRRLSAAASSSSV